MKNGISRIVRQFVDHGVAGSAVLMLAVAPTGCSLFQKTPVEPPPSSQEAVEVVVTPVEHVIRSGDTLGAIAQWYTGKTENYTKLLKANPKLKANSLRTGQVVVIPEELVQKRDPMPTGKAKGGVAKPKKKPQAVTKEESKEKVAAPEKAKESGDITDSDYLGGFPTATPSPTGAPAEVKSTAPVATPEKEAVKQVEAEPKKAADTPAAQATAPAATAPANQPPVSAEEALERERLLQELLAE